MNTKHRKLRFEGMEARLLLSALPFDDSSLAPAAYASVCQLNATLPVFTPTAGTGNDTGAIQSALTAAEKSGGIVHIPAGTWNVAPPTSTMGAQGGYVFNVTASNVVVIGDHDASGNSTTHLVGWMPGMTAPASATGPRFTMFVGNDGLKGDQFRSLDISGQMTPNGNNGYAWGGSGWDMSNKGIILGYESTSLIFNCNVHNFNGEIIYGNSDGSQGGMNYIIRDNLYGSNADSISAGICTVYDCRLGGTTLATSTQNIENLWVKGTSTFSNNMFMSPSPTIGSGVPVGGISVLNEVGSSCIISGNTFEGMYYGINLADFSNNVTISGNTFYGSDMAIQSYSDGYTGYSTPFGYNNVQITGNNSNAGILLLNQTPGAWSSTTVSGNTLWGTQNYESYGNGNAGITLGTEKTGTGNMPVPDPTGNSGTVTPPPVQQVFTSISLTPSSLSITTGGKQQFTATALDQNGNAMSPQPTITWSTTIGSITSTGVFSAPTTAGSATITVKSGTISATAKVTVTTPVAKPVAPTLKAVTGTSKTPTFSGTAAASQGTLTMAIANASTRVVTYYSVTVAANGTWSFTWPVSLATGTYYACCADYFDQSNEIDSNVITFTVK